MEDEVRPLLEHAPQRQRSLSVLPWDPWRARKSGALILISVVLERLAYYGVVVNLFLYLNKGQPQTQSWDSVQALTAVYIINGVSCICAPLGGWLSDSLIGRFWAVITGMLFYILGYSLLTVLSVDSFLLLGCDIQSETYKGRLTWLLGSESWGCSAYIYIILVLVGVGIGFLRANIPPFGAEQVRAGGENAVHQFFNAYYWCINMGSLAGIGILAYIEQNVHDGFFISFLAATMSLCASLIIFCAGRRYYVVHRPGNSVFANILRILGEGVQNTCRRQDSIQGSPMFRRGSHQRRTHVLVALTPSWIDRAKLSFGGSFHDSTVDEVKHLSKNMAFITLLLPYWLVYFQMSTSFQDQGLHMKIDVNLTRQIDFEIPSAWLMLCDPIFVLLLIPLLNWGVYPLLERHQLHLGMSWRIIIGMVMSLLSVLSAALVEHWRLDQWRQGHWTNQTISGVSYNASSLSILWQIPQYCFMGAAESFAGVAGLEYAYTTAPRTFQGIIMGLYAAVEGIGSFLAILLVQLMRFLQLGWINDEQDFNSGHMDYFFYLLAVVQLVSVIVLALILYLRKEPARLGPVEHLEAILGTSALHSEYYSEPGANADPSDSGGGPVDDPETMATQNDPTDSESQANQSAATADSGVSEGDAIHREKPITDDDPTDQQFSAEDNIATAGNPEATLTNESDPEILTERK